MKVVSQAAASQADENYRLASRRQTRNLITSNLRDRAGRLSRAARALSRNMLCRIAGALTPAAAPRSGRPRRPQRLTVVSAAGKAAKAGGGTLAPAASKGAAALAVHPAQPPASVELSVDSTLERELSENGGRCTWCCLAICVGRCSHARRLASLDGSASCSTGPRSTRRTKLIATIGPACDSDEMLEQLAVGGWARLPGAASPLAGSSTKLKTLGGARPAGGRHERGQAQFVARHP